MIKRIVVCADGTWNRPEKDLKKDFPTNVLKLARAIKPVGKPLANEGKGDVAQQVFYDWGVGSYYDPLKGGAFGAGLHKNVMDNYRYIVQNYNPGDKIFLFGFSRGAYTIRSLCGLINNCGILKRDKANLTQEAFNLYKRPGRAYKPGGEKSLQFRKDNSHSSRDVHFVGVWDTVGAMGIPTSFLGLFKGSDEFYDTKLGRNVTIARHAMAIDEFREDFEPTIWSKNSDVDIQQVWFSGAHADIGGGYKPDKDGSTASTFALQWMAREAKKAGLALEPHLLKNLTENPTCEIHKSREKFYRFRRKFLRPILHEKDDLLIHTSVKSRYLQNEKYRPENLENYVSNSGWDNVIVK